MKAPFTESFIESLEWPNGEGYTPCSAEYAAIMDAMEAIKPNDVNLDDLSPADYQEWNVLEDKRAALQMSGKHLGKAIRY
jgi:hypothetical protein